MVCSFMPPDRRRLLLERRDQALTIELGDVVVEADLAAALDRFRRTTEDSAMIGNSAVSGSVRTVFGELEAVHLRHFDVGDDHVEARAL